MVGFLDMLFNRRGNMLAPLETRPDPQNYPVASPDMLAAVASPAPPSATGYQVAGGGGRPSDFSFLTPDRQQFLQDMFIGWAAGATPQQSLALGAAQASKGSSERKSQNQTLAWLQSRGVSGDDAKMLASSPAALNQYIQSIYQKPEAKKPIEVNGRLVNPDTFEVIADFSDPNKGMTDDQREYNIAKEQGFPGTFLDYQIKMKEAGRSQVNIDTGTKLPANYRWKDPNDQTQGVEPIPGGPGEQVPAELAARVGLADTFLADYDNLRQQLQSGVVTGLWDRAQINNQGSVQAGVYRQLESGADALQRMLTGAGMNQTEADAYARRYLPTYTDNAESAVAKLDQLKKELENARTSALKGRGNAPSPAAGGDNDPLGIR